VTVRVEDGRGGSDTQSFVIELAGNRPPEIVSEPVTTAFVGRPYSYDVDAVDLDRDSLTYSLQDSSAGMTIDPATGRSFWPLPPGDPITEFAIPTPNGRPFGITTGSDGNIWFSEYGGNKIAKMSPAGNVLAEYVIPTSNSSVNGITLGPDGNVWFVEAGTMA